MAFTEEDFKRMGLKKDEKGNYYKPKTVPQPRDLNKKLYINKNTTMDHDYNDMNVSYIGKKEIYTEEAGYIDAEKLGHPASERFLRLTLFGEPMPKQSAQQGINKLGKKVFYTQKGRDVRKQDYIRQIKEQIPKDFTPFLKEVHITKYHCIFAPLKAFHKIKGRMERIRNGEVFYKTTQPDLMDNLKKLAFDSMAGIVLGNDGIVCTENDTAKYYGVGGCIIIEMKGR